MQRLSVRLSIVGAVLVLGSAAIVHSVMLKRNAAAEADSADPKTVAKAPAKAPPAPIPAADTDAPAPSSTLHQPTPFDSADLRADPTSAGVEESGDSYGGIPADPAVGTVAGSGYGSGFSGYGPSNSGQETEPTDIPGADNLPQGRHTIPVQPVSVPIGGRDVAPSSVYGTTPAVASPAESSTPSIEPGAYSPAAVASLNDDRSAMSGNTETPNSSATESSIPIDPTAPLTPEQAPATALSHQPAQTYFPDDSPANNAASSPDGPRDRLPGAPSESGDFTQSPPTALPGDAPLNTDHLTPRTAVGEDREGIAGLSPSNLPTGTMGNSSAPGSAESIPSDPAANAAMPPSSSDPNISYGTASPKSGVSNFSERPLAGNTMSPPTSQPTPSSSWNGEPATEATGPSSDSLATQSNVPADSSLDAATAMPASNLPGDPQWEGQQAASLTLEKTAPDEVQVDKQATFQIRVRNVGTAPAENVIVVDRIPAGTEFVEARPRCAQTPDGMLVWQLGTVAANGESVINIQLMPKEEREIGSVAYVSFQAKASAKTVCTRPQLSVKCDAPASVLLGENVTLDITVSNSGSGAAHHVILQEDVPPGLNFHAGRELEQDIGTLKPGESVRLSLALDSVEKGVFQNKLTVLEGEKLHDQLATAIQVVAPELTVSLSGPTRRFLERKATYTIEVANPGTATAKNVELAAYLPKGMKYVTSDNQGQYDAQAHAVYWSLDELPPNKQGDAHVTLIPTQPGDHKLKVDGQADSNLRGTFEHAIIVEGLPELVFTVTDDADPIEVGSPTKYKIVVQNRGTQQDANVQLAAVLPPDIQLTDGTGPTRATIQGQQIVFAPLASIAPKEEAVYTIYARGETPGHHVIRVQLQSDGLSVPVTKEESTRVYTDQ